MSKQAELLGRDGGKRFVSLFSIHCRVRLIWRLWALSSDKYSRCLVLFPNDWRALSKWGSSLSVQARYEEGERQFKLMKSACSKLNRATRLAPAHYGTRYNAGNASLHYARLMEATLESNPQSFSPVALPHSQKLAPSRIHALLLKAISHFESALTLNSASPDALQNLAISYATKARLEHRYPVKLARHDHSFPLLSSPKSTPDAG